MTTVTMKRKARPWEEQAQEGSPHAEFKRRKLDHPESSTAKEAAGSLSLLPTSTASKEPDQKEGLLRFQRDGFVVVRNVLSAERAEQVAASVCDETIRIALAGENLDALCKVVPGGRLSLLLNDLALRKKYCQDAQCVWRHDRGGGETKDAAMYNTRQPHVSKNNGMSNLYHNPLVRDEVTFSPRIYNVIQQLYQAQLATTGPARAGGVDTKQVAPVGVAHPIFARGPDRVNVKAKGGTDMPLQLDRHLFDKSKPPGGGLGTFRVQSFCCLRIDSGKKPNRAGSLEVLQGFHRVWELAAYFMQPLMTAAKDADEFGVDRQETKSSSNKKTKDPSFHVPQQLGKAFEKQHVPAFIKWLRNVVLESSVLDKQADAGQIRQILSKMRPPLCADDCNRIKWVSPVVAAGDLVCWDERLPHRNTRNDSDTERIVAYVSLFLPLTSSSTSSGLCDETASRVIVDQFQGRAKSGHAGSNRDNYMERRLFGSTEQEWERRTTWIETETSRKVLGQAP
jgi:hypothetical protein